ncbi:MAG: hypothetical protein V1839_02040 [archaeon]
MLAFHLSMLILIASFALTTAGSFYAEKKFLKKEINILKRKL